MKKEVILKQLWVIVLVIIAIGFISCEKPKSKDYRDKWVGTYECIKGSSLQQVNVDVIAKEDSLLNITERDIQGHGIEHDVKVNSDGVFKRIPNEHESIKPHIDGNLYKDSLYILYIYPTPGITVTIRYEGKKLKNK